MLIRLLQSSDQRGASDLLRQLGYDIGPTELASRINRVLASPTHFAAVAEERGCICGLVHAYERPALEKAHEVVLQSLVVDQNARKTGIGKRLMAAAEAWAKSRGAAQVVLHTRIDRDDARSFYEQIGYKLTATSHLMAKPLDRF
jgi:GNAT superfamily N-acetyltransferase